MLFEFDSLAEQKAQLKVVGVGGAGGNAVNRMISTGMNGVDFIAINTDAQDLDNNSAEHKIQIGKNLTKGLGAGAQADTGRQAMEADKEAVASMLEGADMAFITAGMGGGTGTGAAPMAAQLSREMSILTVGIVTLPFNFEGPKRMKRAQSGIAELRKVCDTLIVIPNQKLMSIVDKATTLTEAFQMADSILLQATKGISDLINVHGMINLDFADVQTVMKNMGKAIMGTGVANGEERSVLAAQQAISSPLLDNASISGAHGVLINVTGGQNLTLHEIDEATSIIFEEAGDDANIIFGAVIDPTMQEEIRVTVIATGFNQVKGAEANDEDAEEFMTVKPKQSSPAIADKYNAPLYENRNQVRPVPAQPSARDDADQGKEQSSQSASSDDKTKKRMFDDTRIPIYGSDLEVPAFIRRQHE